MSFLLSQFERVEAPAKEAPVKDDKDDAKDLVRKDEKEKKPPTRKGSRSSHSSRASRAVLSSTGGKREREREERQSRSSKKRSGIEKRSNRDRPATDSKRTTRSAAAAAKAAKAAKKPSTGKPKKPTTAKPAKPAKVAKPTTTDAVVSTSKAIVPVVAAPPNPDLTREDPEWASESERAARATSVLKTVKKASRANTKRQRGTNKKGGAQPKEDKPLSAMTLKEIIRQSVEQERNENRKKRSRQNRNKSSGDAKDGKSGEGADGRGSARGGGGAGTSSSPLFKDAGTDGGKESIAPQVQVVDGQIVVNQQSLSVKAQIEPLMKPERRVEESGNKLSAFSYSGYLAPEKWTKEDTDTFYTVLEQFGTDFGTIQKFFPKRERKQIKSKFRREEKTNPEKIELALKTHRGMSAEVCVQKMKDLVKILERPEVD